MLLRIVLRPFIAIYRLFSYLKILLEMKFNIGRELAFILLHLCIISLAILINMGSLIPDPVQFIHNKDSFFLVIYQIQATVATLSIAVTSLLSGMVTIKYYGINIASFVLDLKPKILKFKYLIIINLSYILINSYFISMKLYIFILAVTLSSILLCIKMALDVFNLTISNLYKIDYKDEIKNYILCTQKSTYIQTLSPRKMKRGLYLMENDINQFLRTNEQTVIDDLYMVSELGCGFLKYVNQSNCQHKSSYRIRSILENNRYLLNRCISVIGSTFEINSSSYIQAAIKCFGDLFATANSYEIKYNIPKSTISLISESLLTCDPLQILVSERYIRKFRKTIILWIKEG